MLNEQMDDNSDGKLSKEEFKKFVMANPFVKASYQLKFTKDGDKDALPYHESGNLYFVYVSLHR